MIKTMPSRNVFIFALLMFFGTLFGVSVGNSDKVYAACGADGVGVHGYAGAIIDVVVRQYGGSTVEAPNSVVYVQAINPSTPAGNIYNLNTGKRYVSANFVQINNNCAGTSGARSVVLGYGTTSQPTGGEPGDWALDCDISVRGDNNQPFLVTSRGTPDGARALWGPYIDNPNYGWTSVTISPRNGTTARTQIVYREPPPKTPEVGPVNDGNINFVDCRNFTSVGVTKNTAVNVRFIVRWQQTPGSPLQVIANDSRSSTVYSMPVYYGPATMTNVPYYVDILIFNNNNSTWFVADRVYTNMAPCGQNPEFRPTYSLQVTCEGVWVRGLTDRDNPYAGVRVYGLFYHRYVGAGGGESWAPAGGSNFDMDNRSGDFLIPWPWNLDDGTNQGWGFWIGNYDTAPNGSDINPAWSYTAELEGQCYQATCTLDVQESAEVSSVRNAVIAGRQFGGTVTVNNPVSSVPTSVYRHAENPDRAGGPGGYVYLGGGTVPNVALPDNFIGSQLMASPQGNFNNQRIDMLNTGQSIDRGQSVTRSYTATASTAPGTTGTVSYYPDYFGRFILGNACSEQILVYGPFDITPTAQNLSLDDEEDARNITFDSGISNNGALVDGVNTSKTFTRNGAALGGPLNEVWNDIGSWTRSDTRAAPGGPAEYCASISVSPATGYAGPNGSPNIVTLASRSAGPVCNEVVNKPYVRTYGGDVVAGAVFPEADGSCATVSSDIRANMRPVSEQGTRSGSGSMLGAYASGSISGFTSASLRNTAPLLPKGLSFGNTASTGGGLSPLMGGNYSSDHCLQDYYTMFRAPTGSSIVAPIIPLGGAVDMNNIKAQANGSQSQLTGNVRLNGTTGFNIQHSMFVDGDVYITDNITINTNWGSSDPSAIPSFRLFVKGNIYIAPNVSQLDGVYVAQPDGAAGGNIYTCANGFNPVADGADRYNQCGNQLKVYGSFVANKVHLGRTFESLRNSVAKEPQNTTKAAEVFIFSPEIYLSTMSLRRTSSLTSGDYQYIATLPPIL